MLVTQPGSPDAGDVRADIGDAGSEYQRSATARRRRVAQTKRTSGEEQGLLDAPIRGANGAVWPENGGQERRMPAGGFPILYDISSFFLSFFV